MFDDRPARVELTELPAEFQGGQPLLNDVQLTILRCYGIEREMASNESLFADGDDTYDLIVVLEGEADIVQNLGRPDELVLASYGPSQFLGEIGAELARVQIRTISGAMAESGNTLCASPACATAPGMPQTVLVA